MNALMPLVLMLALAGCVASGAAPPAPLSTAATDPAGAPPGGPVELYHGKHGFDAPPVTETEVKERFVVPGGARRLAYSISWSAKGDAAATIPEGAVVKLKDASGKVGARASIGPGPLPAPAKGTIDAPAAGAWIAEYEGYAPGVRAMVVVSTA